MNGKPLYNFSDARVLGKTIYFTDKTEATKAAAGRGEWGPDDQRADAYVNEREVIIVDTAEEYNRIVHWNDIQKALNKLSDSEKALLKEHFNMVNTDGDE